MNTENHKRASVSNGTVVQLNFDTANPKFRYCMLTVTEVKNFGVLGYIQSMGDEHQMGGQVYYRAQWHEFEVIGKAVFVAGEAV